MIPSQLTFLLFSALATSAVLAGCAQTSGTPAAQLAAGRQQTDNTIAMIQASKGTPEQKAQAISALRASTAQPKS
ncbi:MAG: hypothetical protein EOO38_10190 [Cytophagaceae bacterium]|nr:MAG: hypothetical protein EOO38_10190 [Cytophagaceae bacterium]